ncbi:precorrin-6y C5,15-methyltransferase (decarboxylating) subunit CbiE [Kitasatospora phosalacinea]|uniref:Precorrin-6Y C5,15-methyltransferase (Decarboxylating) n=1 Tax=Kitasatospora phosalacinea TaxID=2065 RepID=A0A9W6PJ86_9ACTN|nr:precorrin-6y C5,15-methyltransferase (decarboxylating) subunit CbiE [Kitasatospora phosalacinea]GLW56091.1 precorrin-6Y C5,15-methyltransferase (decarboxylating) [Kitasatospora phosalacinea]
MSAITVVGVGADGWPGLSAAAREALGAADAVLGGARQLALLPEEVTADRVPWPSPLRPSVPGLLERFAGRRLAVLASGDPMFHGIGRTLLECGVPVESLRVLPHPSSVSLACARLGWPVEETEVVTLVGRPVESLHAALYPGRRLLVLSADAATPVRVAELLANRGYGPSRVRVLEQLGGPAEAVREGVAEGWSLPPGDPLNLLAVDCVLDPAVAPDAPRQQLVPGLRDELFDSDGQLTKRHIRAATLAALGPAPGELLWDVGGGSGSIGIEWLRSHRSCRAVSVERDPGRAERIVRNAAALGVPRLRVVRGAAPVALDELTAELGRPDAVFVGGGLTVPGVLEACWAALGPGGRLVANTVTLESEALLTQWYRRHGGELVKLAVAHAVPVGGFTGWRQAMPVTQWSVVKDTRENQNENQNENGDPGESGAAEVVGTARVIGTIGTAGTVGAVGGAK